MPTKPEEVKKMLPAKRKPELSPKTAFKEIFPCVFKS